MQDLLNSSGTEFCYEDFANILISISPDIINAEKISVALSGGVDSIALLHLSKTFCDKNKIKLVAITINHDLRAESEQEALEVGAYCKSLNIEHHIYKWDHQDIKSNIQEEARNARYNLLLSCCKLEKIPYLLTGHHLGDQIEQILISLSQGAGIYSFCIPENTILNGIKIIRPLLNFSKEEIIGYTKENKLKWWEDPTNIADKYLRNKIRPIASRLLNISNQKKLITAISNIKRASNSLAQITEDYIKNNVTFSHLGYAKFKTNSYKSLSDEIKFSIIRSLILKISKQEGDLRLNSIKIIDQAISKGQKKSLGGCCFTSENDICIIIRDFGRTSPQICKIEDTIMWDNRFRIISKLKLEVRKLSLNELNLLLKEDPQSFNFDDELTQSVKKTIVLTLPAIFSLEKLLVIPHIYYYNPKVNREIDIQLIKIA